MRPEPYADRDTNGYTHSYTYRNVDGYCYCHSDTNGYQYRDCNSYGDCNSYCYCYCYCDHDSAAYSDTKG
jgi:hypothetical protein